MQRSHMWKPKRNAASFKIGFPLILIRNNRKAHDLFILFPTRLHPMNFGKRRSGKHSQFFNRLKFAEQIHELELDDNFLEETYWKGFIK